MGLEGCRVFGVGVTLDAVGQPFLFRAPVGVAFRRPDVFAAEGETEGLETHGFVGDVAGEDIEVGPGDLVAVLLLDRPKKAAGLIEVAVVRPGVERGEALVARACTAATVKQAVGAGSVPCQADHQPAIMAPVSRPPGLAVGHQVCRSCLSAFDIEFLDFFVIVEVLAHRIGLGVVLAAGCRG